MHALFIKNWPLVPRWPRIVVGSALKSSVYAIFAIAIGIQSLDGAKNMCIEYLFIFSVTKNI